MNPFGFAFGGSLMDDLFPSGAGGGFTSFSTFNSTFTNGSPTNANVKRTSTSTRFVNGKKITTKKLVASQVLIVSKFLFVVSL